MNIDFIKYQHISFDLWLTLIKSNPEFKQKRNLLFKDFFEIDYSIEKIAEIVRYYDVLCNATNEKTGLNIDTFEIYLLILNRLKVNISMLTNTKLDLFYEQTVLLFMLNKPFLLNADLETFLKIVRSHGITTNILSNTGFIKGNTLRKLIDDFGLSALFDFQIYSDETKLSKPNSKMFQVVFDEVNLIKTTEKNKILHVGDNIIADFQGAKNYGFDAHLYY